MLLRCALGLPVLFLSALVSGGAKEPASRPDEAQFSELLSGVLGNGQLVAGLSPEYLSVLRGFQARHPAAEPLFRHILEHGSFAGIDSRKDSPRSWEVLVETSFKFLSGSTPDAALQILRDVVVPDSPLAADLARE